MFDGFDLPHGGPEFPAEPVRVRRGFWRSAARVFATGLAVIWLVGMTLLMLVGVVHVLQNFMD